GRAAGPRPVPGPGLPAARRRHHRAGLPRRAAPRDRPARHVNRAAAVKAPAAPTAGPGPPRWAAPAAPRSPAGAGARSPPRCTGGCAGSRG
ncbi:MAG: hypothetical protein ACK559_16495, partial [bacterium]